MNLKLVWLDVESTGLSPERDHLLEVAVGLAELERPFDAGVVRSFVLEMPCPRESLTPFILDMHTRNGLLDECERSRLTVSELEDILLAVVPEVADKDDRPTLAGSTVHFDHGFLRAKMPRLAARFSHRHYDVSAVKLFCRSLGMAKLPKAEAHRAADDVRESMDHALRCARWLASGAALAPEARALADEVDHVLREHGDDYLGLHAAMSEASGRLRARLDGRR